jgi:hypothetical protein
MGPTAKKLSVQIWKEREKWRCNLVKWQNNPCLRNTMLFHFLCTAMVLFTSKNNVATYFFCFNLLLIKPKLKSMHQFFTF